MTKELEPCPFCGGDAKLDQRSSIDGRTYTYSVYCMNGVRNGCGASSGGFLRPEKAIEAWNTRYKLTCKWLRDGDSIINMCSACGALFALDEWDVSIFKHCPNCGAEVVK